MIDLIQTSVYAIYRMISLQQHLGQLEFIIFILSKLYGDETLLFE